MLALQNLKGVVVIDEIQRSPQLFPILRVLADRTPVRTRFLILGSASPNLVKGASESLAGRLESIPISGFGLEELGTANLHRLWMRRGFPRSYLERCGTGSIPWRQRSDYAKVLGLFGWDVHDTPSSTLPWESRQARGQTPSDLYTGFRIASPASRSEDKDGVGSESQGRRFMGGICV